MPYRNTYDARKGAWRTDRPAHHYRVYFGPYDSLGTDAASATDAIRIVKGTRYGQTHKITAVRREK